MKNLVIAATCFVALNFSQAHAADKFKVTSVDCEQFFLWNDHTPVIHYDIIEERKADYTTNPLTSYFEQRLKERLRSASALLLSRSKH